MIARVILLAAFVAAIDQQVAHYLTRYGYVKTTLQIIRSL